MVLKALKDIGAARVAIVECTYSPFVILLSLMFLGETLNSARMIGCALVVAALLCASVRPNAAARAAAGDTLGRRQLAAGMCWELLGLFTMAVGIVMTKPIFAVVPLFWVIVIRMSAGVLASGVLFAFLPKNSLLRELGQTQRKGLLAFACVLSTYAHRALGCRLQIQRSGDRSRPQSNFDDLHRDLCRALLEERMTPMKIAGTALAASGVLMMVV